MTTNDEAVVDEKAHNQCTHTRALVDEEMYILNTCEDMAAINNEHRSPMILVAEPEHQDLPPPDRVNAFLRWTEKKARKMHVGWTRNSRAARSQQR